MMCFIPEHNSFFPNVSSSLTKCKNVFSRYLPYSGLLLQSSDFSESVDVIDRDQGHRRHPSSVAY